MKRTMLLTTVMIMSMLLTSVNANAQRRKMEHERTELRGGRHHDRHNPGGDHRYDRDGRRGHDKLGHAPRPEYRPQVRSHRGRMVRCTPPRVRRGCFVPGWEGRVRYHHDGRWGYYVGGRWVYYDCYYNPYDFFCEPMPPRPMHPVPVVHVHHGNAGEVAAGIAVGTVIGCILGSMAQ